MGIELVLDSVDIRECRDHLQKRRLAGCSSPIDPLNRRDLSKTSVRDHPENTCKEMETPEPALPDSQPSFGSALSSSSSELPMPELIESAEEETKSASSSVLPAARTNGSPTFAQDVRSELGMLSEKSIDADASHRAKHTNQHLASGTLDGTCHPNSKGETPPYVIGGPDSGNDGFNSHSPLQTIGKMPDKEIPTRSSVAREVVIPVDVDSPNVVNLQPAKDSSRLVHAVKTQHPTSTTTDAQPAIGQESEQMPGQNAHPSNFGDLAGVEGLMPKFVRRRSAPASHQVINDEVDAAMYERGTGEVSDLGELASPLKAEKGDS